MNKAGSVQYSAKLENIPVVRHRPAVGSAVHFTGLVFVHIKRSAATAGADKYADNVSNLVHVSLYTIPWYCTDRLQAGAFISPISPIGNCNELRRYGATCLDQHKLFPDARLLTTFYGWEPRRGGRD